MRTGESKHCLQISNETPPVCLQIIWKESSKMSEICRVCLEKSSNLKEFRKKLTNSEEILHYYEDLTKIKLEPQEIHSKICSICLEKLRFSCDFKKQCLENNAKFQKLYGGGFQTLKREFKKELPEEPEILISVPKTDKKDKKKPSKSKKEPDTQDSFFCSYCGVRKRSKWRFPNINFRKIPFNFSYQ